MEGRTDDDTVAGASRAAREQELLRRYHRHGDLRARDQLAEEMLPLARALAGRYAGRGEPKEDLTQTEISERVGVSQMQISRIIRQSIAKLRLEIDRTPGA